MGVSTPSGSSACSSLLTARTQGISFTSRETRGRASHPRRLQTGQAVFNVRLRSEAVDSDSHSSRSASTRTCSASSRDALLCGVTTTSPLFGATFNRSVERVEPAESTLGRCSHPLPPPRRSRRARFSASYSLHASHRRSSSSRLLCTRRGVLSWSRSASCSSCARLLGGQRAGRAPQREGKGAARRTTRARLATRTERSKYEWESLGRSSVRRAVTGNEGGAGQHYGERRRTGTGGHGLSAPVERQGVSGHSM